MSVYLGQDKVGVAYKPYTSSFANSRIESENSYYSNWTRPTGWPDLDSMNLQMSGDNDFIYLSYRTGTPDCVCSFHIDTVNGSATVQLGFVANGKFTAQATETAANNTNKTYWFDNVIGGYAPGYKVVKITGQIKRFYLIDVTRPSANGGGTIKYYHQPLIERVMYIPHMTMFSSAYATNGCGTYSLEKDKVANGTGTALTSLYYAWYPCVNLRILDISGLYTPNVTTMACAFEYCHKLEHLDMRHWRTEKVTTMAYMFDSCLRLQELDLSSWDVKNVTGAGLTYMFTSCRALKHIYGLESWDISKVTSLGATFNGCYSLKDLSGVKNWNVSNVTSISSTFSGCICIEELDLSNWNVGKVTTVASVFSSCCGLKHIYFPQVKTGVLTNVGNAFNGCWSLLEIDVSWFNFSNKVTTMQGLFASCKSLQEINIPDGWDITGCVGSNACYQVFYNCNQVKRITGVSNWDMSGYNYSLSYMFQYDFCLEEVDLSNWNPNPTGMYQMFYNCYALKEIDLSTWGWQNLTSTALYQTFYYCSSLQRLGDISNMGTNGNLTSLYCTFCNCRSLTEISDLSNWDVAKVTTTAGMFESCTSLKELTMNNWNLAACTTIAGMFRYCYNMIELNLENWSIPKITSTSPDYIFADMRCLQKFGGLPIVLNHRYTGCWSLPEDQWVRIFNQLPTVSSKTLYISTANINRLTTAEKAIATGKGWTLAN